MKKDYENKDYQSKRKVLREFAMIDSIQHCVDTVTDDIEMELANIFKAKKIEDFMNRENLTWNHIRKYLIDGYLAFELIFSKHKNVSVVELDPATLIPKITRGKKLWIQYNEIPSKKRVLFDEQILYVSYSVLNSHISYVESLIRPYEQLKIMEDLLLIQQFQLPGMSKIPAKDSKLMETVEYFKEKFIAATRIPENYFKVEANFGLDFNKRVDVRYQKFIKKHAENLAKIYNRIEYEK